MNNHLTALLTQWYERRDDQCWVLGTVYETEGPCYRKAGAMMLFNDLGEMFGLLSGGCLEGDIQRHAKRVMDSGQAKILSYDGSDEDDIAFELGIGCGGRVSILLQPVSRDNEYLQLVRLHQLLKNQESGHYYQQIPQYSRQASSYLFASSEVVPLGLPQPGKIEQPSLHTGISTRWLITPVKPAPQLLVVGGGVDARPLVAMAAQLGWQVRVCDPRPANARPVYFPDATELFNCQPAELADMSFFQHIDAAVVMSHSLKLDAEALTLLRGSTSHYLGLLGPVSRKERVLEMAGCQEEDFAVPICGPAGLDLGGELPESIALSILSQCHGLLHGKLLQDKLLQGKQLQDKQSDGKQRLNTTLSNPNANHTTVYPTPAPVVMPMAALSMTKRA